ncbi:MAG TPA: hypothetical protein VFU73_12760 [Actinocrinis sp.]|nr:hypothetical protein [Actinocrinis sp.]
MNGTTVWTKEQVEPSGSTYTGPAMVRFGSGTEIAAGGALV